MERITCYQCGKKAPKPNNVRKKNKGRPWKHEFCGFDCYNRWRADEHLRVKKEWLKFQRDIWGSTELKRFDVGKSREIGRKAEVLARDEYLPQEGFKDITDMSGMSNQFFIDFIATLDGKRVLVDATIKLKAFIPKKIALAKALRMPLYIIHVSLATKGLYHIEKVRDDVVSTHRVPAEFFRKFDVKSCVR